MRLQSSSRSHSSLLDPSDMNYGTRFHSLNNSGFPPPQTFDYDENNYDGKSVSEIIYNSLEPSISMWPTLLATTHMSVSDGTIYSNSNHAHPMDGMSHGGGGSGGILSHGDDNNGNGIHGEGGSVVDYNYSVSWVSVFLMGVVVFFTIVGNILVCLSVILVRKLRKPQNYLLVSLATSDLFVALFVMPFAILVEFYQSHWPLNSGLCDLWVSADVLCCTASILNLCGISVDRYQAITAPFDYSARSTPRRMLGVIFVVWLGSACVSLPPVLLLGNEHMTTTGVPTCRVSQNFWYQIYATMASFYLPLCVMVVVYLKILRVVTDKKKDMNWKKKTCSVPSNFQSASVTNNNSNPPIMSVASGTTGTGTGTGTIYLPLHSITSPPPPPPPPPPSIPQPNPHQSTEQNPHPSPSLSLSSSSVRPIVIPNHPTFQLQTQNQNSKTSPPADTKTKSKIPISITCPSSSPNRVAEGLAAANADAEADQTSALKPTTTTTSPTSLLKARGQSQAAVGHETADTALQLLDSMSLRVSCRKNSNPSNAGTATAAGAGAFPPVVRLGPRNSVVSVMEISEGRRYSSADSRSHSDIGEGDGGENARSRSGSYISNEDEDSTEIENRNRIHARCLHGGKPGGFQRNNNKKDYTRKFHPRRSLVLPCMSMKMSVNSPAAMRKKKRLSRGLKEHKASTTLGIIMSAFIICWLPFFVLALVRPIFQVEIPEWISSLFNWLGYANSALNPVIYATLNRDFRRPFREILSFRCATLDTLMRKEFYLEQYGEDTDNIRNKASVTLIFLENGNISEPLL